MVYRKEREAVKSGTEGKMPKWIVRTLVMVAVIVGILWLTALMKYRCPYLGPVSDCKFTFGGK